MSRELHLSNTARDVSSEATHRDLSVSDTVAIARAVFPGYEKLESIATLEARFPPRELVESAFVTRVGPSPTGMMHIGGLYAALINQNLAQHSGGVFFLRIEDTDQRRTVAGAVDTILDAMRFYGLDSGEGPRKISDTVREVGSYGPYVQSHRLEIYRAVAFNLVAQGHLYPCFLDESALERIKGIQEDLKLPIGVYGEYAASRMLPVHDVLVELARGAPFTLRFRCPNRLHEDRREGSIGGERVSWHDVIRGPLTANANIVDAVMFKSDGLPTYHFAHLVDDHFMRTTHVIRGEEWISSVPLHLQLFEAAGWKAPSYGHIAPICKQDGASRRKLSKRKDPEADVRFYWAQGFAPQAVTEYLTNLANSNFEEWRSANLNCPVSDFKISLGRMGSLGPLVDMKKLESVSREQLSTMPLVHLKDQVLRWTKDFEPELFSEFSTNSELLLRALRAERDVEGKGGKRLATLRDVREQLSAYFDAFLPPVESLPFPTSLGRHDLVNILSVAKTELLRVSAAEEFFPTLQRMMQELGLASSMKEYKASPAQFRGHIGDAAMLLRVALFGSTKSPDLGQLVMALGQECVDRRISRTLAHIRSSTFESRVYDRKER